MKISAFNSTLSCILKCIRLLPIMLNKKLIFALIVFGFLEGCTAPTAMLGPAYTFTATGGNVFQTGLTYESGKFIKTYTGKTPIENIQEITTRNQEKNIEKQTLESEDFYILVKNKIEKANNILNLSTQ